MKIECIEKSVQLLKEQGVLFESGLAENEIKEIESRFDFSFPPDLRLFLQTGLPVSHNAINWRAALKDDTIVLDRLNWPLEGLLFDVEHNNIWLHEWGVKPEKLDEQFELVSKYFKNYPRLIPLFSHRYLPSRPCEADNPVFSVYQTDIIYYGYSLLSYFESEFYIKIAESCEIPTEPKFIHFWSTWV